MKDHTASVTVDLLVPKNFTEQTACVNTNTKVTCIAKQTTVELIVDHDYNQHS